MTRYRATSKNGRRIDRHRLIMEEHLGRRLGGLEYVHHLNGDKSDNRIVNLRLVSPKEHAVEHGQWKHSAVKTCEVCGAEFRPSPTKRGRAKTCSKECRYRLVSLANRDPTRPHSMYREGAYPSEVASRRRSRKRS